MAPEVVQNARFQFRPNLTSKCGSPIKIHQNQPIGAKPILSSDTLSYITWYIREQPNTK